MKSTITSLEKACKLLKYDPDFCLPNVENVPEKHAEYISNHTKLIIIAEALNLEYGLANGLGKAWEPDWNNHNQYKYAIYFTIKADKNHPSGFGFSFSHYSYWDADSRVAASLLFPTSELALFLGAQFESLHIIDRLLRPVGGPENAEMDRIASLEEALQKILKITTEGGNIQTIAKEALDK